MPFQLQAGGPPIYQYFAPTMILGCILWVPMDQLPYVNTNSVGFAADFSGAGNNLVQATGGDQPTFLTNQINGLPALSFNGTSDYLICAGTPITLVGGASATVFFVVVTAATGPQFVISRDISGGRDYAFGVSGSGGADTAPYMEVAGDPHGPITATEPINTFFIVSLLRDGGATTVAEWQNGANVYPPTSSSTSSANSTQTDVGRREYVGNMRYLNGLIAELIAYNTALTSAQRHQVEVYLGTKYGIAVVQQ